MKKLILLLILIFIQSCGIENSKKYQELKNENSRLHLLIDSLSETSENKYIKANSYFENKNYEVAIDPNLKILLNYLKKVLTTMKPFKS